MDKPTLVIGDIHGHLDRFEALLKQEGLLDRCERCRGFGQEVVDTSPYDGLLAVPATMFECPACNGDGWARTDKEAEVVLLGDVGHFGVTGSPTADMLTWRAAAMWADVILWGNHDRAVVDNVHAFGGYFPPDPSVKHRMQIMRAHRKLRLAHYAHGFVLTHAGIPRQWRDQNVDSSLKLDPEKFVEWVNENDTNSFDESGYPDNSVASSFIALRDAIGPRRGGRSNVGGILWRDIQEKLFHPVGTMSGFRQVFGHSADHEHQVRYCDHKSYTRVKEEACHMPSYCIDIGGKGDQPGDKCLAGIWLPSEKIARVDL